MKDAPELEPGVNALPARDSMLPPAGVTLTDRELGAWLRLPPADRDEPLCTLEIRWKTTGGQEGVCELAPDTLVRDLLRDAMAKGRPADDEGRTGIQRPRVFEAILLLREIS